MKRAVYCVLICMVVSVSIVLSGCVNLNAEEYQDREGISLLLFSDGEDYYAQVMVVSRTFDGSTAEVDDYLFRVFSTEFATERVEGYPQSNLSVMQSGDYTMFNYNCKLEENSWFLDSSDDDDGIDVKYGVFTATVSCDFENPFADAYKSGTKLNNIFNLLKNGNSEIPQYEQYFPWLNLDGVTTRMLIGGRSSMSAGVGGIVYHGGDYYCELVSELGDTAAGGAGNRLRYSYKAMVSYGWFALAILIGIATVGGILLFAKKKQGRTIDLANRGAFASNRDDFGPYGGAAYPFEGFGKPGVHGGNNNSGQNGNGQNGNGQNGNGQSGNGQNGNGQGGGNNNNRNSPFDGF